MVKPEVGQIVWFYTPTGNDEPKPRERAAIISFVQTERLVNLAVIDYDGTLQATSDVQLLQETPNLGDPPTRDLPIEGKPYAQFPPVHGSLRSTVTGGPVY